MTQTQPKTNEVIAQLIITQELSENVPKSCKSEEIKAAVLELLAHGIHGTKVKGLLYRYWVVITIINTTIKLRHPLFRSPPCEGNDDRSYGKMIVSWFSTPINTIQESRNQLSNKSLRLKTALEKRGRNYVNLQVSIQYAAKMQSLSVNLNHETVMQRWLENSHVN